MEWPTSTPDTTRHRPGADQLRHAQLALLLLYRLGQLAAPRPPAAGDQFGWARGGAKACRSSSATAGSSGTSRSTTRQSRAGRSGWRSPTARPAPSGTRSAPRSSPTTSRSTPARPHDRPVGHCSRRSGVPVLGQRTMLLGAAGRLDDGTRRHRCRRSSYPDFREGAYVHERNGWFYLSYGFEYPQRVAYARCRSLNGPVELRGHRERGTGELRDEPAGHRRVR